MFFIERLGLDWERRAPLLLRPNDTPALGPPKLAHLKAPEYVDKRWMAPAQFDEYFKFTFVRNPWDRVASFYRFLGYDRWCSFNRFVSTYLPRQLERNHWFMCPQADYLHDAQGRLLVDFVGRFERLSEDFAIACSRMGLPAPTLAHVNHSGATRPGSLRWLRRPALPYRDMYGSRSRELVERIYARDVETFSYAY